MPRSRTLSLLAAASVPLLAACGVQERDGAPAAAPVQQASSPRAITIHLTQSQFEPAATDVAAGQEITFANDDGIAHTATATNGADFDSGTLEAGGAFSVTAWEPGTIAYVCEFHPGMTGSITVS